MTHTDAQDIEYLIEDTIERIKQLEGVIECPVCRQEIGLGKGVRKTWCPLCRQELEIEFCF